MKAILRSINNFSCKLKQSNNLKYNISPKIRSNKFKNISGNGNIVIEDALNKYLKDYKVYGNTYQNITRGINIFNINNGGSTSPEISIDNDDYVSTAYNNANGSVTHYSNFMRNKTPQIRPSTNYLIVVEILSVQGTGRLQPWTKHAGSCINNSNPQLYFNNLTAGQKIFMPVTTKSEFDANTIYDLRTLIIFEAGQSGSITFRLSLLTDTTITSDTFEYEPYTGGQPSPNPGYLQEIVSCGDKTKNLLGFGATNNGKGTQTTYDKKTGLMTTIGTATQGYPWVNEFDVDIPSGTSLTISSNSQYQIYARLYYDNSNYEQINSTTGQTRILTHDIIKIVLLINIPANTTINETYYVQIEENSIATSYEPYGYKIPVNVRSENLLDLEYELETQYATGGNVITNYYSLNNDVVSISRSNATYGRYFFNKLTLDAGTYTLSFIPRLSGSDKRMNRSVRNLDTQKDIVVNGRLSINDGETQSFTFTLNSKQSISFSLQPSVNDSGTLNLTNIQLVKGSTAPSKYIPYYNETTNIYLDEPLRGIGEYSDYIDFVNQKVVRNISEVVLNGSETWNKNTIPQNIRTERFSSRSPFKHIINLGYCDTFVVKNESMSVYSDTEMFQISSSTGNTFIGILINIDRLASNTVADFVAWLSSNPVTLDYVLLNPTEEDIELPNINLIEGKNIITIGTEVQGVFEVEYYSKEIIDISNYKYNLRKVED